MNSMVWLGGLLMVIGLFVAIPRRMRAGSSRDVMLEAGHSFPAPKRTVGGHQDRRGRLIGVLIGLGIMALGGLCIVLGS